MTEKELPSSSQYLLKILSSDKLPVPEVLREYERIMPGITKLLIEKAIQHQQTRTEDERRALNIYNLKSFAGLIFGFLIGVLGLGGGFYLTFKGYNVIGIIFSSSTLVTLVMTFIYGSQSKRNGSNRNSEQTNNLNTNK
jgi:uncharacterized membrane protein